MFDRNRVDEMLRAGIPYSRIMAETGCSKGVLSFRRQRLGLDAGSVRFDWGAIQDFYDDNHTVRECVQKFGVSKGAVYQASSRGDIKLRAVEPLVFDRTSYNVYMREYKKDYYQHWVARALDKLGGKCVGCGVTDDLQFDHIDRAQKRFDPRTKLFSVPRTVWWAEVEKCQLLCFPCHVEKSVAERGFRRWRPGMHGTLTAYNHCGPPKCELCRGAMREYMRRWRLDKTQRTG